MPASAEERRQYQRRWRERHPGYALKAAHKHRRNLPDEVRKERDREARQKRHAAKKAYVDELKAATPCADCGQNFPPYVMDFDHLGDKVDNVSVLLTKACGLEKIKAEIAKCEIVCANCHRERTHARA